MLLIYSSKSLPPPRLNLHPLTERDSFLSPALHYSSDHRPDLNTTPDSVYVLKEVKDNLTVKLHAHLKFTQSILYVRL